MDLKRFREAKKTVSWGLFGDDRELVSEIQGRLSLLGLLDPPADGKFGPVSNWALRAFCERRQIAGDDGFSPEMAEALLAPLEQNPFPLNLKDDFPGRVLKAMQKQRYWITRHPLCCNIVYVEGCDVDGRKNDNAPNEFNDLRLVIRVKDDGIAEIAGAWEGTTEPGRKWVMSPMDPEGAARIQFGQYKAWAKGIHHLGKPGAHEALVQVADVVVCRDLNKDFSRVGDKTYKGVFGINQHWGYDLPKNDLGGSSAGCLVGRSRDGHREFMSIIKEDTRYAANNAYRFMSTIMPVSDLED